MKKTWSFAALGLVVGLGIAVPQSRADQPPLVISNSNSAPAIVIPAGDCGCAGTKVAAPAKPKKTVLDRMEGFFNGPGHGCLPNTDISCSTWRQEYNFLFGSCRDFFGCPCLKTPEQLMSVSEGEYLGRTNPGLNRVNRTYP